MRQIEVVQGNGSFALGEPDYVDARILAANTAETVTTPNDAEFVIFSGNADFYVRYNGTATVPSGDVNDGTASELNPTARHIKKGNGTNGFSIIAPVANTTVTMSFFKA